MNEQLKTVMDFIQQNENISAEEKSMLVKDIRKVSSDLEIAEFKLERTEKVKRTTAILLEETIEELEQKRKAVESQNRELGIESSLERVRTVAMGMRKKDDMLEVCRIISQQSESLGIKEIRNVQTAIIYEEKGTYLNYEYYAKHDKLIITEVDFKNHELQSLFANRMLQGAEELFAEALTGKEVLDWYEYQKTTNQFADSYLENAQSLNYYFYSLGPVALGISTYVPLNDEEISLFKRFRNVFDLAYRRFLDIEQAEAQTREAQIEVAVERVRAQSMAMRQTSDLVNVNTELLNQLSNLQIAGLSGVSFYLVDKDEIVTVWDVSSPGNMNDPNRYAFRFNSKEHPILGEFVGILKSSRQDYFVLDFPKERLILAIEELKAIDIEIANMFINAMENGILQHQWNPSARITGGILSVDLMMPPADDTKTIVLKMAGAFNQAYQRFLDLQKAEAQAREALIEASLERIRSAAMAMRDSAELGGIIYKLYGELTKLDARLDRCFIMIVNPENKGITWWLAGKEGLLAENGFFVPINQHPSHLMYLDSWKNRTKKWQYLFEGKEKRDWDRFGFSKTELARLPDIIKKDMAAVKKIYLSGSSDEFGSLVTGSHNPLPEEQQDIISRFAIAFNQAFIRFLDLQKAEAQARESKIELSLERVRAKVTAMRESSELLDIVVTMRNEFVSHNHEAHYFWHMRWLPEKYEKAMTSGDGTRIGMVMTLPRHIHGDIKLVADWEKSDEPSVVLAMDVETAVVYVEKMITLGDFEVVDHNAPTLDDIRHIGGLTFVMARTTHGEIGYSLPGVVQEPPVEDIATLVRFAGVFDLAYKRFEDLQIAERQHHEARIELALERVRSRTMAMLHSDELAETVTVMFEQFKALGEKPERMAIEIVNEKEHVFDVWATQHGGSQLSELVQISLDEPHVMKKMYKAWKEKTKSITIDLQGNELEEYFHFLKKAKLPVKRKIFGKRRVQNVATFSKGILTIITPEPRPHETIQLLERFAAVFDGTYTRFFDLQKAEAQAREAQIEAALERVRSRTMGMHRSDELRQAAALLFQQVEALGVPAFGTGFNIWDNNQKFATAWMSGKDRMQPPFKTSSSEDIYLSILEAAQKGESLFVKEQGGEELKTHYKYLNSIPVFKEIADKMAMSGQSFPTFQIMHCAFFSQGYLMFISFEPVPDAFDIFKRFAKVFEQTYTRFLDLQRAEAQAREAQIEAALERVRSRTMAMQKSDELAETSAVLFQQLIQLGIEPNRLYITIIKDDQANAEFWITDEDGSKVSSAFDTNLNNNPVFKKMLEGWKGMKSSLTIDMKGEELQEYFQYLSSLNVPFKGGLAQTRRIQYLGYFNKGFIGMASPVEQPEETIHLLARFAAVFNLTFTRFNDLKIAEAHAIKAEEDLVKLQTEKQRAEEALAELQVTQKQLIQSEKMASLGELTAGIAHEIQNPLNFVNNFSEVSNELLDEMKLELDRGDTDEAKAIALDVKLNLEKILHHGKRADAIVKGMLQHSRSSSGVKEPTDINALADEYLRLAYHGLRAKDKSFNATLKTGFDESIGKIDIVAQDIGRVILNLITNAFYAVDEKKKAGTPEGLKTLQGFESYEPTVFVTTKKNNGTVEIKVADNGPGIPQKVLDKIFQPFFTTKPTGEGTGLGLSLAYDIVKSHGGELKVETKEGEGSEFIIRLPD